MESYQSHESKYSPAAPGIEKIRARWIETDSMAGVGLDPDVDKIPEEVWDKVGGKENIADGISLFNRMIVDATANYAVDFKLNSNFYQSEQGRRALADTFDYIKATQPAILRVCDGKFGDVGNTAEKIAEEIFGNLDADAVLLNPYLGLDAIKPFTDWKDKLVVLCINTSNPTAEQIQDLILRDGNPLWKHVLNKAMSEWNYNGNIIPVLSSTHPGNLVGIRETVNDTPILLAGIGAQGGVLEDSVPQSLDSQGFGLLISSSRGILYPPKSDDQTIEQAARSAILELRDNINLVKSA